MTLEQKIENIPGNLKDAYKQAVPGTLKHVDELMRERRDKEKLRNLWFYTPDGSVYSMDGKTPTLRITREAVNPVLNHIDDAFGQLVNRGNYKVLPADFEAVKAAADTVTINLTQLGLQRNNKEWNYLAVDTSTAITEYDNEQQKLLRRVFGPTDDDYTANMKMLRESRQQIKETKVYVLNPQYVKKHAKESPIARASWLNDFDNNSNFNANVRYINYNFRLRGVRRGEAPAGHTPGKKEVPGAPLAAQEIAENPVLENRIRGSLERKEAFDYNGTLYVPVSDKRVKL